MPSPMMLAHRVTVAGDVQVRLSGREFFTVGRVERDGNRFAAFHTNGVRTGGAFKFRRDAVTHLLDSWGVRA